MLKRFSHNIAALIALIMLSLVSIIQCVRGLAQNSFLFNNATMQGISNATALYILSDAGNAELSSQFQFDADGCMIPVLFTIQADALNQTDAEHISCTFSYNGATSDSVSLWRTMACIDGTIENNGDLIVANSPVLLSDLDYDIQTENTSVFYSGLVYLQVPATFNTQSDLTLTVSTVPDQVMLGQSGLSLTPSFDGFQYGVAVNGSSSLDLFNSYINAWQNNTVAMQTSVAGIASNGARSGDAVMSMEIQTSVNGTLTYSSSCTVPTNTRFGNVTSGSNNAPMVGKLPGYLGGYNNRVVADSVPRLQINIKIPKTAVDNLYANNDAAEKGYLSFNYSYSAPVEPGGNGTESNPYTAVAPADGHFRIWRNGNQSAGEAASVPVVSGTEIPISNFLNYRPGYPDDEYEVSVNLEAVRHSETALPITVTLLNSNHQPVANSSDTISVQPVLCGLQIDSNNDGEITMDDEYVEHAMFKNLPLSTAENPVYTPVKLTFAKVYNNTLPITLRQKFNVSQPAGVTFYEKTGSGENVTYTPISLQNQTFSTFFANSESTNYYARTLYIKADTPVTAGEIAVETSGSVGDVGQVKDEVRVILPHVNIFAYRPVTENSYGNYFQRWRIERDINKEYRAGIRINGDQDENENENENDFIEIELSTSIPASQSSGVSYVLKRENDKIRVHKKDNANQYLPIPFDGNNEAIIPANELTDSYWVEHLVTETGTGTENSATGVNLEFIARSGTTDLYSSQVKFYPFTLLVIILGGEDQIPSDPASIEHGMFRFAVDRYRDSEYDIHMYDEEEVTYENKSGQIQNDDVFNEIKSAYEYRKVKKVVLVGYSHGGGAVYQLSNKIEKDTKLNDLEIALTCYVDAIEGNGDLNTHSETRRPVNSAKHINYYQRQGILDYLLDGNAMDNPAEGDFEVNLDANGELFTHFTIDDAEVVQNGLYNFLKDLNNN